MPLFLLVFPAVVWPIAAYQAFWVECDYSFWICAGIFYGIGTWVLMIWGIIRFFRHDSKEKRNAEADARTPDRKKELVIICRLFLITCILFIAVRYSRDVVVGSAFRLSPEYDAAYAQECFEKGQYDKARKKLETQQIEDYNESYFDEMRAELIAAQCVSDLKTESDVQIDEIWGCDVYGSFPDQAKIGCEAWEAQKYYCAIAIIGTEDGRELDYNTYKLYAVKASDYGTFDIQDMGVKEEFEPRDHFRWLKRTSSYGEFLNHVFTGEYEVPPVDSVFLLED